MARLLATLMIILYYIVKRIERMVIKYIIVISRLSTWSLNVWKLQMDIPIPISHIFHTPSCIKKLQLTTQLMCSNFLFLIPFLASVPFLGFSCYLIKRGA